MSLRNRLYDWGWKNSSQADAAVISVGNLSVGGTGKSPAVAWLAQWLRQHEFRVAVLSRGYGELDCGRNDEALELELRHPDVPHLQSPDRTQSARLATAELDMQVLLLDDGFQHRRLRRDLDIVLLDVSEPPSAMRLLPAGVLREPMSSLRRADIVLFTRCQQADRNELTWYEQQTKRTAPHAILARTEHRPSALYSEHAEEPVSLLKGKRVLMLCSIGKPSSFLDTLERLGAIVADQKIFADHHQFTSTDIEELQSWAAESASIDMVVCTMKDWVKLQIPELGGRPLRALVIEMAFTSGLPEVEQRLEKLLRDCLGEPCFPRD